MQNTFDPQVFITNPCVLPYPQVLLDYQTKGTGYNTKKKKSKTKKTKTKPAY